MLHQCTSGRFLSYHLYITAAVCKHLPAMRLLSHAAGAASNLSLHAAEQHLRRLQQLTRCMQAMSTRLSRVMLLAIEVAVEFWLSLQWSPQAQWLRDADTPSGSLREEVSRHTYSSSCSLGPIFSWARRHACPVCGLLWQHWLGVQPVYGCR